MVVHEILNKTKNLLESINVRKPTPKLDCVYKEIDDATRIFPSSNSNIEVISNHFNILEDTLNSIQLHERVYRSREKEFTEFRKKLKYLNIASTDISLTQLIQIIGKHTIRQKSQ